MSFVRLFLRLPDGFSGALYGPWVRELTVHEVPRCVLRDMASRVAVLLDNFMQ